MVERKKIRVEGWRTPTAVTEEGTSAGKRGE